MLVAWRDRDACARTLAEQAPVLLSTPCAMNKHPLDIFATSRALDPLAPLAGRCSLVSSAALFALRPVPPWVLFGLAAQISTDGPEISTENISDGNFAHLKKKKKKRLSDWDEVSRR